MDTINGLGDDIICHILSYLPTKEAALTSVLSKRWRNLFVLTPNLHLDDHHQVSDHGEDFIDFVDRVLAVSNDLPLTLKKSISIKCRKSVEDDTGHVTRWLTNVLKLGVQYLDIEVIADDVVLMPLEIFTCNTIVELKLTKGFDAMIPDSDVSLPSLKTLYLESVYFYNSGYCVLEKLLSSCPLLEELTTRSARWQNGKCCPNVSSSTLKKLTIEVCDALDYWDITFDTPSLVYLEYSDLVPRALTVVNLESLVEAKLDLHVEALSSNPTNLIKELRNVEFLEILSVRTWEMFCMFREVIPVFINLSRLTITIDFPDDDWEFLPILVGKSPNLHTLVIKGTLFVDRYEREYDYGSSCPVKVLKITEYGGETGELEQMKLFLEKLSSSLELVKVLAYATNDKEKSRITKDLLKIPRSSKCNIKIMFCEKARPRKRFSRKV
ncbi:hypothetical protein EUTSA_v10027464mg [Eutrema salsugineum]|uniref:FBD domain-containing protein n=1 Tax=Eutrema salsugineum TaxID=72664 RepID=V4MIF8_EUTSA|nr:F-box protein At4g22280 [Eutrema salsugineum]ESQ55127.1 hypothetical protein EUTSA_v10027464mg [Eutrema salsugineum]